MTYRPTTSQIVSFNMDADTLQKLDVMAGPRGRSRLIAGLIRAAYAAVEIFHIEAALRRRNTPPPPFDLSQPNAPVLSIKASTPKKGKTTA